jgi:hypothetical protein
MNTADKRQETLIALILGGSLLLLGVGWLGTGDSLGAKLFSLLLMVIPGIIITIYGIHLLLTTTKQTGTATTLKRYDWVLITIGLLISFFVVMFFTWGINQS